MQSSEHPHIFQELPLHPKKIRIWCTASYWHVMGPPHLQEYCWWKHTPQYYNQHYFTTGRKWTWLQVSSRWHHLPYFKWNNVLLERIFWWPSYFQKLVAPKMPSFNFSWFLSLRLLKRSSIHRIATTHTQWKN